MDESLGHAEDLEMLKRKYAEDLEKLKRKLREKELQYENNSENLRTKLWYLRADIDKFAAKLNNTEYDSDDTNYCISDDELEESSYITMKTDPLNVAIAKIHNLEEQLHKLQVENNKHRKVQLTSEEDKASTLNILETQIKELQLENTKLNNDSLSKDKIIAGLSENNEMLQKEIEHNTVIKLEEISNLNQDIQKYTSKIQKYEEEISHLNNELKNKSFTIKEMNIKLIDNDTEIKNLLQANKLKNDKKQTKIINLQEELKEKEEQILMLSAQLENEKALTKQLTNNKNQATKITKKQFKDKFSQTDKYNIVSQLEAYQVENIELKNELMSSKETIACLFEANEKLKKINENITITTKEENYELQESVKQQSKPIMKSQEIQTTIEEKPLTSPTVSSEGQIILKKLEQVEIKLKGTYEALKNTKRRLGALQSRSSALHRRYGPVEAQLPYFNCAVPPYLYGEARSFNQNCPQMLQTNPSSRWCRKSPYYFQASYLHPQSSLYIEDPFQTPFIQDMPLNDFYGSPLHSKETRSPFLSTRAPFYPYEQQNNFSFRMQSPYSLHSIPRGLEHILFYDQFRNQSPQLSSKRKYNKKNYQTPPRFQNSFSPSPFLNNSYAE